MELENKHCHISSDSILVHLFNQYAAFWKSQFHDIFHRNYGMAPAREFHLCLFHNLHRVELTKTTR
jgi:hypothetical protein